MSSLLWLTVPAASTFDPGSATEQAALASLAKASKAGKHARNKCLSFRLTLSWGGLLLVNYMVNVELDGKWEKVRKKRKQFVLKRLC